MLPVVLSEQTVFEHFPLIYTGRITKLTLPQVTGIEIPSDLRSGRIAIFAKKDFFANNFWTQKAGGFIRAPLWSSHQGVSKHMHGDFEQPG